MTEAPEIIRGSETPRIYTPTRIDPATGEPRILTPDNTHGFAAVTFAEQMMGIKLYPWQEWLLKHALELNDDGTYRFRYIIILVARQNGKSLLLLVLALWHLFAVGSKEVIATAQDLGRSEAAWKEALEWIEADEELSALLSHVDRGHPKLLEVGGDLDDEMPWKRQYRVASAGRRGARGFSGDLALMDELREHQNWETWGSVTNTMNARPMGQAWAFSNAGDNLSIVLRRLRAEQHKILGWPDGDADKEILGEEDAEMEAFLQEMNVADMTALFEWSAAPGSPRSDLHALAQANPSMNHPEVAPNCPTDRTLLGGLIGTPPWQYDTEVRCIWVPMSDLGPFIEGQWEKTFGNELTAPKDNSAQVVCVTVSRKRNKSYIARAGWGEVLDKDGNIITVPVVGIAEDRPGTDWIVPWLKENRATYEHIVVQDKGSPVSSLIPDIEAVKIPESGKLPLIPWGASNIAAGTGIVFDRVRDETIRHLPHRGLDDAAFSAAVKILSRAGFEIDEVKSPTDAAPLQAVIGAIWGLEAVPAEVEPTVHDWPDEEEIQSWIAEADEEDPYWFG